MINYQEIFDIKLRENTFKNATRFLEVFPFTAEK